jgi:hypothetical protein
MVNRPTSSQWYWHLRLLGAQLSPTGTEVTQLFLGFWVLQQLPEKYGFTELVGEWEEEPTSGTVTGESSPCR